MSLVSIQNPAFISYYLPVQGKRACATVAPGFMSSIAWLWDNTFINMCDSPH